MNARHDTNSEKASILVVDDEKGPRESLKIILSPRYRVLTVADGAEALAVFDRERPDVVVSDIRMPGISGTTLLREIKSRNFETPVILITGYANLASAREAVRGGAFDYLEKPYDVTELQAIVGRALEDVANRRQHTAMLRQIRLCNRKLQEQISQLDQKSTVAELSAELIHDLNSPMTVLQSYVSLLECSFESGAGELSSDEIEKFMTVVKAQVERCISLTRNFLAFARQSGPCWELASANKLIDNTLFVLRARMIGSGVDVEKRLAPHVPESWLLTTTLQQVLYNLLINAIDAIDDTERRGSIVIESRLVNRPAGFESSDTPFIQIAIGDNGAGIPEAARESVFLPFFSTKDKGKGTGLGLPICKRGVEGLHGRLAIEHSSPAGTTFTVTIPLLREPPIENESQDE